MADRLAWRRKAKTASFQVPARKRRLTTVGVRGEAK